MLPDWLVQIGSLAGLLAFVVGFYDRRVRGRPYVSLKKEQSGSNVVCKNFSQDDIIIRKISSFPRRLQIARDEIPRALPKEGERLPRHEVFLWPPTKGRIGVRFYPAGVRSE
jgi:hypothetical protein